MPLLKSILLSVVLIAITSFGHGQSMSKADVITLNKAAFDIRDTNPSKGLEMNLTALNQANVFKNDTVLAPIFSVRGVLFKKIGRFDSSGHYHLKALSIRETIRDTSGMANSINNLGTLYYEQGLLSKAKIYFKKALKIRLRQADKWLLPGAYNNMSIVMDELGYPDSAILYAIQGLTYVEGNPSELNDLGLNLGIMYCDHEEWMKSIKVLRRLYPALDNTVDKTLCLFNIGLAHEGLQNFDSAGYYYQQTHSIVDSSEFTDLKLNVAESDLILALKRKDLEKELQLFERYYTLSDLDRKQKINSRADEIVTRYEVDKKEAKLALLEVEQEKSKIEKTLSKRTIIGLIVFMVTLLFFLMRYFRQKHQLDKLELEAKQFEIAQLINQYELDMFEAQTIGQYAERKRIAGDLHDQVGSLLAAANLEIENLKGNSGSKNLTSIQNMIEKGIDEVRNVSHNLYNESLKGKGLKGSFEAICQSISKSKKLKIDLYFEGYVEQMKIEKEREIFKILMELLSNAMKHAEATEIVIQMNQIKNELNIIFEDNGKGFNAHTVTSSGLGLTTINSRVNALKGNWQIDSLTSKGSTTIINIPL